MRRFLTFLFILSVLFYSCEKELPVTGDLIVEGYLYANRPFDSIRIGEAIPTGKPLELKPIINADAEISTDNQSYKLTGLQGHPGVYRYQGSDFIIEPGISYTLSVSIGNRKLTAWTSVPVKSSGPKFSKDTIYSSGNNNPESVALSYSILTWDPVTEYSFIIRKYLNTDSAIIDSNSLNSYVPYYLQKPFNGNIVSMQIYDFRYFGSYNIIICQVNKEFEQLLNQSSGIENPIIPQENISGGYGIFTGIYCDTVKLKILRGK